MDSSERPAPGSPGIKPRWANAAKCGIGTAVNALAGASSRVWFTLADGIFTEIFWPRPDIPSTRDLGLIVTDGKTFFSEEKTGCEHEIGYLEDGALAYRLTNCCKAGRYRIEKRIFTHPRHPVVFQRTRFTATRGQIGDYRVYALLAPHLGGHGIDNSAWIADYRGRPTLFARRDSYALAMACSTAWKDASVGFVGVSDGWQQLHVNKRLLHTYTRADGGNVALAGEIDLAAGGGEFTLMLAFSQGPDEAAHYIRCSLFEDVDAIEQEYLDGWHDFQYGLARLDEKPTDDRGLYRLSAAVLRAHEGKLLGGTVAALACPWGADRQEDERLEQGYHLVWPRDLVETAGGLLAAGAFEDALRRLAFLRATQEADGHWPQNMWLTGAPFWAGIQLDQTGLPILLVELLAREGLDTADRASFWPMVRAAAGYLAKRGPCTDEDRWERQPGYTPFTLAVIIAALAAAADMAERCNEPKLASSWRRTADNWNASIEGWLYVTGSDLASRLGVEGYYVRALAPEMIVAPAPGQPNVRFHGEIPTKNGVRVDETVCPDVLALVRYGLRGAGDPRIVNTVKVIDALLKTDLPGGPCWHRFNGDQYGETKQGLPYPGNDKGGIGRGWPLLTGERAHYELAAGRPDEAERLLRAMESFMGPGGLLPEQIWDEADIPEHGLVRGKPTGSAMPLAWAHAEFIKLRRSLRDGEVFDLPVQAPARYRNTQRQSPELTSRGPAFHSVFDS